MNRTSGAAIDDARAQGRAALVIYLPVGYPDVDTSITAAVAAVEAGADIIELGLPYSDPGMDGPVVGALPSGRSTAACGSPTSCALSGRSPTPVPPRW